MEGVRVFSQADWEAAGLNGTQFAEQELKRTLEGLAKHLFGARQPRCCWLHRPPMHQLCAWRARPGCRRGRDALDRRLLPLHRPLV